MTPVPPGGRPDLCVIGGGAAGHALAFAAAALGARCTLVDPRERLGAGQAADLAEAMLLEAARSAAGGTAFDPAAFRTRLGQALADGAPTHAVERLRTIGVTVAHGTASFVDPHTVVAGTATIRARRFVIATGATPSPPPWGAALDPGLLLRPATVALHDPRSLTLAVVAETPDGLAWAQALRHLGATVTLVLAPDATAPFDPELIEPVLAALARDGVRLCRDQTVIAAVPTGSGARLSLAPAEATVVPATHLLIARQRTPATAGLALDRAGIACTSGAPVVDRALRTTNRRVWAIGDVLGGHSCADAAVASQVGLVLRAALFRQPVRYRPEHVPLTLRTIPAVAQVGTLVAAADGTPRRILRWPLADTSEGRAAGAVRGGVKLAATASGRLHGAGVVGPAAAEAIGPWVLALARGFPLGVMASLPAGPTGLAEASRRASLGFLATRLSGVWTRRLLALLRALP